MSERKVPCPTFYIDQEILEKIENEVKKRKKNGEDVSFGEVMRELIRKALLEK